MRYLYAPAIAATLVFVNLPEKAHAEYNNLLNNIYKSAETSARADARSQSKFVSRMTERAVGILVSIAPFPNRVGEVASVSLAPLPQYVGTALGEAWQGYAERTLTARARSEVRNNEPEIRSQFDAGQARNAERQRFESQQRAIEERRARTYGPPKPNAFY